MPAAPSRMRPELRPLGLDGGDPAQRLASGGRKRFSCNSKKNNQAMHAVTKKRSVISPTTPVGLDVVCVGLQRAAGVWLCWGRGHFFHFRHHLQQAAAIPKSAGFPK